MQAGRGCFGQRTFRRLGRGVLGSALFASLEGAFWAELFLEAAQVVLWELKHSSHLIAFVLVTGQMTYSHVERTRFGSPPVWQDDLVRNWEDINNDGSCLSAREKLSPTQKRRRRLQRHAVHSDDLKQKFFDTVQLNHQGGAVEISFNVHAPAFVPEEFCLR